MEHGAYVQTPEVDTDNQKTDSYRGFVTPCASAVKKDEILILEALLQKRSNDLRFIGLGLLLILISQIINVDNAKFMLSGYNMMSEENRKKVDIHNLVPYIRKFHLFLGISLIAIGVNLTWLFGTLAATLFLAFYPVLAYLHFTIATRKFYPTFHRKWHWVTIVLLVAVLAFLGYLFYAALREDRIIIANNTLVVEGQYGDEIALQDIRSVSLVDTLPSIAGKNDGFDLGTVMKGNFRTSDGRQVKLIFNAVRTPCIRIELASGETIYYTSKKVETETIYDQIRGAFPEIAAE